jgi:D-3-phosphoglycerate dehydrogenase
VNILLLETLHPEAEERLAEGGRVILAEQVEEAAALAARGPVHAILTRGRGQVRRPLLEACRELRVVARAGVGLDNVDVAAATDLGIPVVNAPGSTTIAVAEQTLLLMSALVRGLYASAHAVKQGDWEVRRLYAGDDLAGKRLGLVGMGQIAGRVARLAGAYDMEVVYWSRAEKELPYPRIPLDELLATSDVVSLHVALTPETHRMIGRRELAAMKRGAYLVNTARGAVVDQAAVLEALREERLAGFGADVLDPEPPHPEEPLLGHPRALITPHTSALTGSTYRGMCLRTAANVLAALRGGAVEPGCVANEQELSRRG